MQEEMGTEHSEEALRASELRYRRLFETAKDGILILDAKTGQITDVNPFLVNLLGYSHDELVGARLWEIGPFKDIKECQLAFVELQEKEYIRYESLPLETKDGRSISVEFVSNVYGLSAGTRVIQCNIRDITKRKQMEEALRQSEERFRVAQEFSDSGVQPGPGFALHLELQFAASLAGRRTAGKDGGRDLRTGGGCAHHGSPAAGARNWSGTAR